MDTEDYTDIRVCDLLDMEKDSLIYKYDFGDGLEHQITLEKVMPKTGETQPPVCLKGKMNCPPEDCGGVWGYAELLEILKQPEHEEYESYIEWLKTNMLIQVPESINLPIRKVLQLYKGGKPLKRINNQLFDILNKLE